MRKKLRPRAAHCAAQPGRAGESRKAVAAELQAVSHAAWQTAASRREWRALRRRFSLVQRALCMHSSSGAMLGGTGEGWRRCSPRSGMPRECRAPPLHPDTGPRSGAARRPEAWRGSRAAAARFRTPAAAAAPPSPASLPKTPHSSHTPAPLLPINLLSFRTVHQRRPSAVGCE